jgi:hypothetical protein
MSRKSWFYLGAIVGSTAGSFVPALWGADAFSGWGIFLGVVGGLAGIWAAYRLSA